MESKAVGTRYRRPRSWPAIMAKIWSRAGARRPPAPVRPRSWRGGQAVPLAISYRRYLEIAHKIARRSPERSPCREHDVLRLDVCNHLARLALYTGGVAAFTTVLPRSGLMPFLQGMTKPDAKRYSPHRCRPAGPSTASRTADPWAGSGDTPSHEEHRPQLLQHMDVDYTGKG